MDILDEAKKEAKREKLIHIYKVYGKYLVGLFLIVLIVSVSCFWWQSHQESIVLEEANKYNDALLANRKDMVNKLENLKEKKSIYACLAHLELAAICIGENNFNKAAHNYEQFIKRKCINGLYLDYARLMLIKTKLVYGKISDEMAIKLFKEYLNDSTYFQNVARIAQSVLLVSKKGSKEEISSELNFVTTDVSSPEKLRSLAKIIQKRVNEK